MQTNPQSLMSWRVYGAPTMRHLYQIELQNKYRGVKGDTLLWATVEAKQCTDFEYRGYEVEIKKYIIAPISFWNNSKKRAWDSWT